MTTGCAHPSARGPLPLEPELPRVFIGYDPRESLAVTVLTESIQARSSVPVQVAQIRQEQLGGHFQRPPHPLQSTAFSFSRFLVPWLSAYRGWSLFLDADMLCLADLADLWNLRDGRFAVQVVKHNHSCEPGRKFLGMPQTPYARKNWSSVILFNNARCRALTPERVNTASGLDLHQFQWLEDGEIGTLPPEWNVLVGVQPIPEQPKVLHYTLGGPWFADGQDRPEGERWLRERDAVTRPAPEPRSNATR